MSTDLTTEYQSIVDDLGQWAAAFGLRRDAQIAGTGSMSTESPTFVMGNVSLYRVDSEGMIYLHRRIAGVAGEVVFMLRPRPGRDAEMVRDVFMYGAPAPDHSAN